MGFLNLFLLRRRLMAGSPNGQVWMTDLGRSPSGSRQFASYMSGVYPHPNMTLKEDDDFDDSYQKQRRIAHEFHKRFQKEAGMAHTSHLEGMNVVKGSNGKEGGGAAALVQVNGSTRSRNQQWNNWIHNLCPDPNDEVIMVGYFSVIEYLFRIVGQHLNSNWKSLWGYSSLTGMNSPHTSRHHSTQ